MSDPDDSRGPNASATPSSHLSQAHPMQREIEGMFEDLDQLLKNPDMGAYLTERGINLSLAIVAADGLKAYLVGKKEEAAEDFATVADEIRARMVLAALPKGDWS
jgi:hypothetical protein